MNNPNSEPRVVTIRLTPAQRSALECSGLELAEANETGLLALRAAWDGANGLDIEPDTFEAVLDGLAERCNAEDAQADEQDDAKARGACTALCNLSARLIRLRRPDRIKGDDDGLDYGHPRDARDE